VEAGQIDADAVTATEINVSSLSAINANCGTLNAGVIQNTAWGTAPTATNNKLQFNLATGVITVNLAGGLAIGGTGSITLATNGDLIFSGIATINSDGDDLFFEPESSGADVFFASAKGDSWDGWNVYANRHNVVLNGSSNALIPALAWSCDEGDWKLDMTDGGLNWNIDDASEIDVSSTFTLEGTTLILSGTTELQLKVGANSAYQMWAFLPLLTISGTKYWYRLYTDGNFLKTYYVSGEAP